MRSVERQLTHGPGGRILTNTAAWSPDGEWIVYDTRSDAAGECFDGTRIEMIHAVTGEVRELYHAQHGAHCGIATFHPHEARVVFVLGPEHPTPDWTYAAHHRQGVTVDLARPGCAENLDARDLVPPFTPGALRGGSHLHVWNPSGDRLAFTYEDHPLAQPGHDPAREANRRNVGVCLPHRAVPVPRTHPRNHPGSHFTVLVTRTTGSPRPGSDEIQRACEESWVGNRALAFQGEVLGEGGAPVREVFLAELPDDLTTPGEAPLAGTTTRMPAPPRGVTQRRLTFTADRRFPGLQGPRHWLHASPVDRRIAFLMRDDAGVVQLWTISPRGDEPRQLTRHAHSIASAFTWSPDGRWLAHHLDGSVCVTDADTGATHRLTDAHVPGELRPEACVFSPDGRRLAFVRRRAGTNHLHVLDLA